MGLGRADIESTLASGLPGQARWMSGDTPLDFEFTVGSVGLHELPDEVLASCAGASTELLVFGRQDFAEGGGASPCLCVRERAGSVYGFDPEREEPLFLLNSSVDRFVATFRLLSDYLTTNEPLPSDCESRVRAIDPEAYSHSDW